MSKKFGKFLLFSAVAGAAAYGAYHYFQAKDNTPSSDKDEDTDDDFDDFSEDLDEETTDSAAKERSYVSLNLDKAEAIASEAFHKAKEVIADSVQQVKDTVKSVTEGQSVAEGSFTDLTAVNKEKNAENSQAAETAGETPEGESVTTPDMQAAPEAENGPGQPATEKVEEFYDDDLE